MPKSEKYNSIIKIEPSIILARLKTTIKFDSLFFATPSNFLQIKEWFSGDVLSKPHPFISGVITSSGKIEYSFTCKGNTGLVKSVINFSRILDTIEFRKIVKIISTSSIPSLFNPYQHKDYEFSFGRGDIADAGEFEITLFLNNNTYKVMICASEIWRDMKNEESQLPIDNIGLLYKLILNNKRFYAIKKDKCQ
jgi:hypothetical protein